MCFGEINTSWLTRTEAEGNIWCFCSVRPLEMQHAPASFLSDLGNGFLFGVSRHDRAELHGIAGGTAEEDRVKKATQAMKVLSKVQFDWQIVVENEIQNILL